MILAPNSGLIRISDQIAADRYSYLSMLGWVVVAAAGLCGLWRRSSRPLTGTIAMIALGLGALLVLIPMTRDQCRTWRDSEILWTHALKHGAAANSWQAYANLGNASIRKGEFAEAAHRFAESVRLNPDSPYVNNNYAWLLAACPDPVTGTARKRSKSRLALRTGGVAECELSRHACLRLCRDGRIRRGGQMADEGDRTSHGRADQRRLPCPGHPLQGWEARL